MHPKVINTRANWMCARMDKKYKDLKDNFVSFSYYSSQKLKSYSKNLKPAKSMHKMDTQTNLKSFGRNMSIIILQNIVRSHGRLKGGGTGAMPPPWACQGGHWPPPLANENKKHISKDRIKIRKILKLVH